MRLFIALDVSESLRATLSAVQATLAHTRAAVRWTEPGDYHVTIKFLGEVGDMLLPELTARLAAAALQVPAFELEAQGLRRFPAKGPARTIICHIRSPDQRVAKLHRLIDSAVGGMGLPMDTRVLVPHLTLGRVQSNHGLNRLLRLLQKHELDYFGAFVADSAKLYHSIPTDRGMRHDLLFAAPLLPAPLHPDSTNAVAESSKPLRP